MNKRLITKKLKNYGMEVCDFAFTEDGHRLTLECQENFEGWDILDMINLEGFVIMSPRDVSITTKKITLVPAVEKEFSYYIQKYVNSFGLSRKTAMTELERIIKNTSDQTALLNFWTYKSKFE